MMAENPNRRGPRGNAGSRHNQVGTAATTAAAGGPQSPQDIMAGAAQDVFGAGQIGAAFGDVPAPPPPTPTSEIPGKPDWEPPEGMEWYWDETAQDWRLREIESEEDRRADNDLLARINDILSQYGLNTPGLLQLAQDAISNGWGMNEFMLELRRHPDYLAKPLFAANIQRGREGGRVWSEGEVLNYADSVRSLAQRFGYADPSDAYIAEGFLSGKSAAEYEHHLNVQQRVREAGAGVALVYKQITGDDIDDQDLHEVFDRETNTADIDRALRQAELRGRPFTLGLGIRTEAEARALEMLGVSPEEAFTRYQGVAQTAPRFERLRTIEDLIAQGLPNDFGSQLGTAENGLLIRALVFQQPDALAELQAMTAREIGRFRSSSGAVAAQGGQQLGLLSATERASYG